MKGCVKKRRGLELESGTGRSCEQAGAGAACLRTGADTLQHGAQVGKATKQFINIERSADCMCIDHARGKEQAANMKRWKGAGSRHETCSEKCPA